MNLRMTEECLLFWQLTTNKLLMERYKTKNQVYSSRNQGHKSGKVLKCFVSKCLGCKTDKITVNSIRESPLMTSAFRVGQKSSEIIRCVLI